MVAYAAVQARPHVLIVEDDAFLGLDLTHMIEQFSFDVIGPITDLAVALKLVKQGVPDAAILDINLGQDRVWPVAEALEAQGIPFLFASGQAPTAIPDRFRARPYVGKPVMPSDLDAALVRMGFGAGEQAPRS